MRPIASLIRGLQLTHVLDVGCGSGELLVQLGAADPNFVGWGIEMNPTSAEPFALAYEGAPHSSDSRDRR